MTQRASRSQMLVRTLCSALLGGLVVALVLAGLPDGSRESHAAPAPQVDIQYLSVTGEGSSAKAWYDGATAAGVPLQDALDKFAKEGYEVARITDNLRSEQDSVAFAILLQRIR